MVEDRYTQHTNRLFVCFCVYLADDRYSLSLARSLARSLSLSLAHTWQGMVVEDSKDKEVWVKALLTREGLVWGLGVGWV